MTTVARDGILNKSLTRDFPRGPRQLESHLSTLRAEIVFPRVKKLIIARRFIRRGRRPLSFTSGIFPHSAALGPDRVGGVFVS